MTNDNDGYEIALQRIEKCRQTRATKLDLRGLDLRELPEGIGELTWLTHLDLGCYRDGELSYDNLHCNNLIDLPKSFINLQFLTNLNLRYNHLTTFPESILQLHNLTLLDLSINGLSILPENISHLINLTFLDLSYNNLDTFSDSISQLTNLTSLNLGQNRLSSLPESIGQLVNLTSLYLGSGFYKTDKNQVTMLPESIGQLLKLTSLNLSANRLSTLPDAITHLHNLTYLDLSFNNFTNSPNAVTHLQNLISLNLRGNRLTTIPDEMGHLQNLTSLDLSNNQITALPYAITRLQHLKTLTLWQNPDLSIPPEFLQNPNNVQALFDYLRERRILLNEVKVLIVGEAGVGKTTLVRTLLGETINWEEREPTPGIIVSDDWFPANERDLLVHFWDFGGQEIMHNTHRLFLTTRSCYLLVLDATQNEEANKVFEWLKTIHLYAPDAPIILVINKWDLYKRRLNVPALEQHHPIAAVIETSCATQEGIKRLRTTLQQELATLKHLNDEIPAKWMEVRKQVGAENRDYLEYQEYEAICATHEVIEGTYASVADLLHALGVLFTYSNDPTTKLTHILNPNWVTGGIYPILNDPELLQGRGFVTDGDIARVLIPKGYPGDRHPFILSMMFVFELAYRLEGGRYLVPDLLPKAPPPYEWQEQGALRFVYQYDFVPPGLFSRFVVRMRDEVNPEQVWRTGVILHQLDKPYGRVVVDTDAKRIEIAIALPEDDYRDPRTLLDALRDKFKKLHDDYAGVKVQELVPIRDSGAFVDYADLLFWAKHGKYEQLSRVAGTYDVRALLNGISARTTHYALSADPLPASVGERRKKLVEILIREFPKRDQLEIFMYSEGLEAYLAEVPLDNDMKTISWTVERTLENAGMDVKTGRSILGMFLEALTTKASGHREDVAFLQAWARELG